MPPLLSRYARTDRGEIIIDVAASRVQDLYNDFDRNAPYVRRDLDQDLAEYLRDCAREIGRRRFVIRITLTRMPEDDVVARIRQSVRNYFHYVGWLERRKMRRAGVTSLVFLGVGLCIFALTKLIGQAALAGTDLLGALVTEGLTVAGWVAVWEAVATFLIRWTPFHRSLRVYNRLAGASVSVQPPCEGGPAATPRPAAKADPSPGA